MKPDIQLGQSLKRQLHQGFDPDFRTFKNNNNRGRVYIVEYLEDKTERFRAVEVLLPEPVNEAKIPFILRNRKMKVLRVIRYYPR